MEIKKEDIKHIANLSMLNLSDDNILNELYSSIVSYSPELTKENLP